MVIKKSVMNTERGRNRPPINVLERNAHPRFLAKVKLFRILVAPPYMGTVAFGL